MGQRVYHFVHLERRDGPRDLPRFRALGVDVIRGPEDWSDLFGDLAQRVEGAITVALVEGGARAAAIRDADGAWRVPARADLFDLDATRNEADRHLVDVAGHLAGKAWPAAFTDAVPEGAPIRHYR